MKFVIQQRLKKTVHQCTLFDVCHLQYLLWLYCIEPEKPGNITVTSRETDYLNISWTLSGGRVDYYEVNISNEELTYLYSITTSVTAVSFINLHPGRLYRIIVTAVAGRFTSTSDQSSIATGKLNILYYS